MTIVLFGALFFTGMVNASLIDDLYTVAIWDMDSTSSTRVLDLNTARGNDLKLFADPQRPAFETSYNGTDAISFDGSDDRSISNLAWDTSNTSLMFECKINADRIEAFAGNDQTFFHINNSVTLHLRGSRFYMDVYSAAGSFTYIETSTIYNSDNWYSLSAIINEDGAFSLQVNDEVVSGQTSTGSWNTSAETMYLGANRYGTGNFEGLIDDVKIATVPEPISMALFSIAGLFVLRSKKK
jgi:hypothetical protein